jgi:hypothetical protein
MPKTLYEVFTGEKPNVNPIIKIKPEIKAALDALKRPGQTYSGVIQELLDKRKASK